MTLEERIAAAAGAGELLSLAEEVLEGWVRAHGQEPAPGEREGFRLLALHHQGTRGIPSFNACRETCREIAYHYNLLTPGTGDVPGIRNVKPGYVPGLEMMRMLVRHLALFVGGKLEVEGLGDFCCASRSLRRESGSMSNHSSGERDDA